MTFTSENVGRHISGRFPVLRKRMAKLEDQVYPILGNLAEFMNENIKCRNGELISQCQKLAEDLYANGDHDVRNAFYCDFCEVLDLRGAEGLRIFGNFSAELQELYRKAQRYIGRPYPSKTRST